MSETLCSTKGYRTNMAEMQKVAVVRYDGKGNAGVWVVLEMKAN